jgi:hypothetical protein
MYLEKITKKKEFRKINKIDIDEKESLTKNKNGIFKKKCQSRLSAKLKKYTLNAYKNDPNSLKEIIKNLKIP